MKYVWKIVVRHSMDEPSRRQGYALAGSMGEALEMAGDPNAVAIPQTRKMWPGSPREAYVMTDEARQYQGIGAGKVFDAHGWTNHSAGEYVSCEDSEIHTNTVEGFYSIFKRGMKGVYQHCGKQHLHRYAAEFDFRYSNRVANGVGDAERGEIALRSAVGKRLTYRRPDNEVLTDSTLYNYI